MEEICLTKGSIIVNIIDRNPRWKKTNEYSGKALFLMPNGKPVKDYYLRHHIIPVFKKICSDKSVSLYTMRHTFATHCYDITKDIKMTAKRLGHRKTDTVDVYVHILEGIRSQVDNKKSLFSQALRQQNNYGGKLEKKRHYNKK